MRDKGIDFERLLGFETVSDRISGHLDFQDEAIDAKLGAKVGLEANLPRKTAETSRR